MSIDLSGQVAIVTGAGQGLGRAHALALARQGARVVVNDLGGRDGVPDSAESVAAEIRAAGGEAVADGANVTDWDQVQTMVDRAMSTWGRVDILVNNAGILRDKSFLKMPLEDFRVVLEVHLMGSVHCTKAVWSIMREQAHGRIVLTGSSTGLYGNFGQSNYGAVKMAMVGLMNTLHLEGAKYDIRVNCLVPAAGTAMTGDILPPAAFELLSPEAVSPAVVFLASDAAPSRNVLCAAGGCFAIYKGFETEGVCLAPDHLSADGIAAAWDAINAEEGMREFQAGHEQTTKFIDQAARARGLDIF